MYLKLLLFFLVGGFVYFVIEAIDCFFTQKEYFKIEKIEDVNELVDLGRRKEIYTKALLYSSFRKRYYWYKVSSYEIRKSKAGDYILITPFQLRKRLLGSYAA